MLEVDDIAVIRGERLVIDGLSFRVAPGGAVLLVGPNGSGKSTLLRVLAGLGRIEAGRVLWDGADALADRATHGGRVSYVGHQDAVKPGLTAAENLGQGAEAGLAAMGLSHLAELPARMLSAGQKRRLALARLVLRAAPLWLLDEPTLGVDAASVTRFGDILAAHRRSGGIVIAATHLPLPLHDTVEVSLA